MQIRLIFNHRKYVNQIYRVGRGLRKVIFVLGPVVVTRHYPWNEPIQKINRRYDDLELLELINSGKLD